MSEFQKNKLSPDDYNILIVVPARGGSKGIKHKNLKKINDKTLVALVGEVVLQLDYVDRAVISTDMHKIAIEAKKSGLDVPFMRPEKLSEDIISDVDVLTHALIEVENIDRTKYDIIIMLQPTSPLRKPDHVTAAVKKLIDGNYDSVLTVSETDSKAHPLKQLVFDGDKIDYYDKEGIKIIARQQLRPVYHRDGAAYVMTRDCLLIQKTTIGENASAVKINDILVNIDSEFDLEIAQLILSK